MVVVVSVARSIFPSTSAISSSSPSSFDRSGEGEVEGGEEEEEVGGDGRER